MSSTDLGPRSAEGDSALEAFLSRTVIHELAGAAIPRDLLRFGLYGSIVVIATGVLGLVFPGANSIRRGSFFLILGTPAADMADHRARGRHPLDRLRHCALAPRSLLDARPPLRTLAPGSSGASRCRRHRWRGEHRLLSARDHQLGVVDRHRGIHRGMRGGDRRRLQRRLIQLGLRSNGDRHTPDCGGRRGPRSFKVVRRGGKGASASAPALLKGGKEGLDMARTRASRNPGSSSCVRAHALQRARLTSSPKIARHPLAADSRPTTPARPRTFESSSTQRSAARSSLASANFSRTGGVTGSAPARRAARLTTRLWRGQSHA